MEPMDLASWIVVGAIAGWLASQVIPSSLGLLGNVLIGMIGAFVGGWLFVQFGAQGTTGFSVWSIFVSFIGAAILLFIIREVQRRRA